MNHEELVASLDAQAEQALKDAVGQDNVGEQTDAGEQHTTETPQGSQTPEEPPRQVSQEEQPVEVAPQSEPLVSSPEEVSLDGLTLENAEQRLKNADSMVRGAQKKMTQASQEAAALRKENEQLKTMMDDQRRATDDLRRMVEELRSSAPQQVTEPPAAEPHQLGADKIVEEYGEEITPLVESVSQTSNEVKQTQEETAKLRQELDAIRAENAKKEANEKAEMERKAKEAWRNEILAKHADAFTLSETNDFRGWLSRQAPAIQGIFSSGSSSDVNYMFDLYKRDVGVNKPPRQQEEDQLLDSARDAAEPNVSAVSGEDPTADTTPSFTPEQLSGLSGSYDDWVKNEAAIDAAMAAGTIR